MTENEMFAYIAGIIDGEGCFSISNTHNDETFNARIVIQMNEQETIDLIRDFLTTHKIVCGSVLRPEVKGNRKEAFRISIQQRKSLLALCKILDPLLIAKKDQCRLFIAFLNICSVFSFNRKLHAFVAEKKALMYAVKTLNQKGDLCEFVREKIRSNTK